jgi:lysophospholipid acyltransferase (LPLAT)-like uncharacterized protein
LKKLFVILLNLIAKTWKIKIHGELPKSPAIIGFWHSDMLPCWYIFSKLKPIAVVSKSPDGQILSDLLSKWGFELIRGSSSTDGRIVLENIIARAKDKIILMTPDGPRGPSQEMKAGIAVAAQRSGTPIYLLKTHFHNYKEFSKSWDKFKLPLPFSKIDINIIGSININKSLTKEEINNKLQELGALLK